MHTETYLRSLDLEARGARAGRRVDPGTEAERRLGVWVVEATCCRCADSLEADYVKAAEALLEEARGLAEREPAPPARARSTAAAARVGMRGRSA